MSKRRRQNRRQRSKSHAPKQKTLAPTEGGVDVVIPVYEQFALLDHCLDSLEDARGDVPVRVILVDDGSPKSLRSRGFDREFGFPVKIATNPQNRGFPFSVNRGWKMGSNQLVLFLNTDLWLAPKSISIMAEEFVDEKTGVVGSKLLFPAESVDPHRPAGTIQHAGLVIGFDGKPVHIHMGWPGDHPRANVHREMQLVTGACMMVRRHILELTEGFAEVYGRGTYEDMELCIAARLRGFKVMYQPEAWGYHFAGGSVKKDHAFPIQQNLMLWKHRCGDFGYWDEWRFW